MENGIYNISEIGHGTLDNYQITVMSEGDKTYISNFYNIEDQGVVALIEMQEKEGFWRIPRQSVEGIVFEGVITEHEIWFMVKLEGEIEIRKGIIEEKAPLKKAIKATLLDE